MDGMDGMDKQTGWGSQPRAALSYWQLQVQELSPWVCVGRGRIKCPGFSWGRVLGQNCESWRSGKGKQPTQKKVRGGQSGAGSLRPAPQLPVLSLHLLNPWDLMYHF